jgi:hypothetical protein
VKGEKLIAALIMVLVLAACATAHSVRFMRYQDTQYPPTTNIEVLQMKPSDRSFTELGVLAIRVKKNTQDDSVLFLIDRAKEIGADAIVILGEVSAGAIAMPLGNMAVAVPIRDLQALAIRYESR